MDSNLNHLNDQDDLDETFNPLDLFCSSIDTLRGTEIDQTIPANWASRPLSSGITPAEHHTTGSNGGGGNSPPPGRLASIMSNITTTTTNNDYDYEQEQLIQTLSRQGIPPSLRRSAWIMNVVHASNPNMNKSDVDDYGTFRTVRVIGKIRMKIECMYLFV